MKRFSRKTAAAKREDTAHSEVFNDRMRQVLARDTSYDEASVVEERLRNMVYGSNKK